MTHDHSLVVEWGDGECLVRWKRQTEGSRVLESVDSAHKGLFWLIKIMKITLVATVAVAAADDDEGGDNDDVDVDGINEELIKHLFLYKL